MSLTSFLLPGASKGKSKAIDKGLDELFHSTAPSVPPPRPSTSAATASNTPAHPTVEKKRKAAEDPPNVKAKRSKSGAGDAILSSSKAAAKMSQQTRLPEDEPSGSDEEGEDEDDEGDVEDEEDKSDPSPSDSDDEGEPSKMVHESSMKSGKKKTQSRHGKAKYVPSEETPAQRDTRTVFVGNVAIEVTKSRPSQKQLKRHILSFVLSAKIESVRFRSIAFKKPTSELPSGEDGKPPPKSKSRDHDRERAASWRGQDKDDAEAAPPKRFLTPKEKKRVAFIKHEIHDQVDAVNAYVVFAHPPSAQSLAARPANVPPPAAVMDPYEAARICAEKGDGSVFLGRTLRIDVVKKGAGAGAEEGESVVGVERAMAGDPKATVFVGNLEFTSKEEDLRAFFESLVCEERGKPGEKKGEEEDEDEDEESEDEVDENESAKDANQPRTWVKRVRIIRDRDTQLGKGFAYVQFVDRECVDEILALDQSKLKFARRKLRVQRCKTLPGGPKLRASNATRQPTSSKSPHTHSSTQHDNLRPAAVPRLVPATKHAPKGNPALGAKLAHLPKEERKKAKAMDPDRVARRLAKKRATALAEKGVKARVDRDRVRRRPSDKGAPSKGKEKPKKRVRSKKALAKMNTKK